jgi:hypothetical protein
MSVQWLSDCETVLVDDDGVEILLEAPYDVFIDDDGVVIVDDDGVELMKEDTELVTPSDIAVCAKRRSVVAAGMVLQMRIDVVRPAGAKGCGCEDV